MAKFKVSDTGWAVFHCPGCEHAHRIRIRPVQDEKEAAAWGHHYVWSWNGNLESPTISPSLNIPGVCHSFVRDGRIEFLSDCTHKLAGQTVDIPEWE